MVSTSVGASRAHWEPLSTAWSIASRLTMVLPEPTSPWSSRLIGRGRDMSAVMSASTCFCPSVRGNGRLPSSWSNCPPRTGGSAVASSSRRSARRTAITSAMPLASSYFNRRRAASGPAGPGSWISRIALFSDEKPIGVKPSGSSTFGSVLSTACTAPMMVHVLTFDVAGYSGSHSRPERISSKSPKWDSCLSAPVAWVGPSRSTKSGCWSWGAERKKLSLPVSMTRLPSVSARMAKREPKKVAPMR